jgi:hypothetical protein
MKFGIKKETLVEKTNINGKVLFVNESWKVYRKMLFGLLRVYIEIRQYRDWQNSQEVRVEYTRKGKATSFGTKDEAESLIADILRNPDKFVRYK